MLIIQKFGGSSLADGERIKRAGEICAAAKRRGDRVAVVVSAMGKTTNELTALADTLCPLPPPRELDALLSTGEQQSAALLAAMLNKMNVPALSFTGRQAGIVTDGHYGSAEVLTVETGALEDALERGFVPVVCGFQGATPAGDITTLGRGGSDTTAVILSAALRAGKCEIYTDVDGIYTADPRTVPDARRLEKIDSRDMLLLSRAGSKVLHYKSVEQAIRGGVEIELLSSFHRGGGTLVCPLEEKDRPLLAGMTGRAEAGEISVIGRGADSSVLSEAVLALGKGGLETLSGSVGDSQICLRVPPDSFREGMNAVHGALFI